MAGKENAPVLAFGAVGRLVPAALRRNGARLAPLSQPLGMDLRGRTQSPALWADGSIPIKKGGRKGRSKEKRPALCAAEGRRVLLRLPPSPPEVYPFSSKSHSGMEDSPEEATACV